MFDLDYKSGDAFIPIVVAVKAELNSKASSEDLDVTNENVDELSGTVESHGEAIEENSAAISQNANAIAENSAAISDESAAREAAIEEVNEKISEIPKFKIEVVDELPEEGDPATIYLLRVGDSEKNMYKEYIFSNGEWEELGPMIDLTPYAKKEELDNEISAREAGDQAAMEAVASEASTRESALNDEASAREAGDQAAMNAISEEVSAREAGDQAAMNAISEEISAREAADNAGAEKMAEIEGAVANEVAAREAAVAELNGLISDETSAREEAIASVNEAVANEKAERESAISAEESARHEGDASAMEAIENVSSSLNDEVSARKAGDQAAMEAVASEASARESALNDEVSARAAGDQAAMEAIENVSSSLSNEASSREAGDQAAMEAVETVSSALNDEVSARETGDQAAIEAIASEASTMESAVNALSEKDSEQDAEIAKKVEWSERDGGRKHIVLDNHNNILGKDTEGGEYNLAMVSKWNVADFGSASLPMNLNSKDGIVTINDNKQVATVDQIPAVDGFATKSELDEAVAPLAVKAAVDELVNQEATMRSDADETAMNAIEAEAAARESADDELRELIGLIPKMKVVVVDELPETGDEATFYLVRNASEEDKNMCSEYIFVNGTWEMLGTQSVDLSDYAKTADVDSAIAGVNEVIATKAPVSDVESLSGAVEDLSYEFASVDEKLAGLAEANNAQDIEIAKKTPREMNGANGKALIFNESDGGGAKFEHNDGTWSFAGVNDGGENGIAGQIYAVKKNASNKMEGTRIDITKNGMYYTVGDADAAERLVPGNEIATKKDIPSLDNHYTKNEVDDMFNSAEVTIGNSIDKVATDSKEYTDNAVQGLASEQYVDDAIAAIPEPDLSGYATVTELNNAIASIVLPDMEKYYTKTETDEALENKVNVADYMTFMKDFEDVKKAVGALGGNVTWSADTVSELKSMLTGNNGTIKLFTDVTEEDGTFYVAGGVFANNKVTLNLNGHSIKTSGRTNFGMIKLRNTQELTVTGGNMTNTNTSGSNVDNILRSPVFIAGDTSVLNLKLGSSRSASTMSIDPVVVSEDNGTINIASGNYSSPNNCVIYCVGGTINISGGVFRSTGTEGSDFLINCQDAPRAEGKAKIVVTGGKFYDFDPANNRAEGEGTNFVAEGYQSVASTVVEDGVEHTVYTVKKA